MWGTIWLVSLLPNRFKQSCKIMELKYCKLKINRVNTVKILEHFKIIIAQKIKLFEGSSEARHRQTFRKNFAPNFNKLKCFQISCGATSSDLSDKQRFPSFFRTVPSDTHQVSYECYFTPTICLSLNDMVQEGPRFYFNWWPLVSY